MQLFHQLHKLTQNSAIGMYFLLQEPLSGFPRNLSSFKCRMTFIAFRLSRPPTVLYLQAFNLNLTRKQEEIWTADAAYQMRSLLQ